MLDAAGGGAEEEIAEEAMTMSAHGDEVATLLLHPFNDFGYRISIGQLHIHRNALGLELRRYVLQIRFVVSDLTAYSIRAILPGGPPIGNVKEHDATVGQFGQAFHVPDDRAVGRSAIESDEDGFIHA